MGRRPCDQIARRDDIICEIIFEHKGVQNAIKGPDIAKALNKKGFRTTAESIHSIIGKIIEERNYPICSVCGKGYYYPKNDSDIQAAIDDINKNAMGYKNESTF